MLLSDWMGRTRIGCPAEVDEEEYWVCLLESDPEFGSEVVTFRSDGKMALMTGRVKRPTRPTWTISEAVVDEVVTTGERRDERGKKI